MMDNQDTTSRCPKLKPQLMARSCMVKDEKEEAPKT